MAEQETSRPLLRWLGITAGVLAILTFLGIYNYQRLFSALGWSNPSISAPRDNADSGVCASAAADVTSTNMDAPATASSKVTFYGDQGIAFGHLAHDAKDATLEDDLINVQLDLTTLQNDWFGVAQGTGGDEGITSAVGSLRQDESTLESWCQVHTGTW